MELDAVFKQEGMPIEMMLLLHEGIWFTFSQGIRQQAKKLINNVMEHVVELSISLVEDFEQ